jgi:membrane protease YdiL (CAAX protease family)
MKPSSSRAVDIAIPVLAAALFVPLFIFRSLGPLDFWWWMSLNIALLIALGAISDRGRVRSVLSRVHTLPVRKIIWGILSAAVLYAVFFVGNRLSRAILPFAGSGISGVYGFKAAASTFRIACLIALFIGPGEELFWRGFLQRRWQNRFGRLPGFLMSAALYTLVHAGSGNPILILSAAVCGIFWGALYLRTGSVLLVAVSHTIWDLAVFLILPFHS